MSSNTPTPSHMEERIDLLTKDLASKRRSTNWSTNLTLIVGLAAIALLCGYFGYGYYMLDDITDPQKIVDAGKMYVTDYSAEARRVAAEEVRKSAPVWAKVASDELVANMPSIRQNAEESIEAYFDEQLSRSRELTRQEFEKIMKEHREDFEEAIQMIIEEDNADEFVNRVMPLIEEQYSIDMKSNVANVLGGLQDINRRIEKLARGKNLNPIEEQQRHILGLTMRLRAGEK